MSNEPASRVEYWELIRQERISLGLSPAEFAERAGISRTFLGQIESGRANPSLASLRLIARALGTQVSWLIGEGEASPTSLRVSGAAEVVRIADRRRIHYPRDRGTAEILTPNVQRRIQVTMEVDEPLGDLEPRTTTHEIEEFALILEGTYEAVVGGDRFVLYPGDSIYIKDGAVPHTWRAIGDRPGRCIWVSSPPTL